MNLLSGGAFRKSCLNPGFLRFAQKEVEFFCGRLTANSCDLLAKQSPP
jgi:hypothetical protein